MSLVSQTHPESELKPTRAFWFLFAGLALVALLPVFWYRFFAAVDYPTHLSIIRVLRLYFEDSERFRAAYGTRLLQPYWGFYLPALLLSTIMSIDLAGKIVLAATCLAMPVAVLRVLVSERLDPRPALLAFPLVYCFSFQWGFVPFMAGLALALLSLPAVMCFARSGEHRHGWRAVTTLLLWSVGIFCAHATAWALWAVWAGWVLLVQHRPPGARQLARAAPAFVLPLLGFVVWSKSIQSWGDLAWMRANPQHHGFLLRRLRFAHVAFAAVDAQAERVFLGLFAVGIALILLGRYRPEDRWRVARWGGLAATFFAVYWLVPVSVGGLALVYQRGLVFAFLFALLCGARQLRLGTAVASLGTLLTVASAGSEWIVLRQFNAEVDQLRGCLAMARPDTNLIGLIGFNWQPVGNQPFFLHADSYHTQWNLGRVFTHFMETLPTTAVYPRDRTAFGPGPPPNFNVHPTTLDYDIHARKVHYFLMRDFDRMQIGGSGPALRAEDVYFKQWRPNVRKICRAGMWTLFENLPVTQGAPIVVLSQQQPR
jgi:hypothetical protein